MQGKILDNMYLVSMTQTRYREVYVEASSTQDAREKALDENYEWDFDFSEQMTFDD